MLFCSLADCLQCESKKFAPLMNFYTPVVFSYPKLSCIVFIKLSLTLITMCHVKRDHLASFYISLEKRETLPILQPLVSVFGDRHFSVFFPAVVAPPRKHCKVVCVRCIISETVGSVV